jgi:two-component system KDP operon response regulator KdpE
VHGTILIVDDEEQICRVLRTILFGRGYGVVEAKNGEEAIKTVIQERPDRFLLEVNMPGKNGLEVCSKIRLSFDGPVIMQTVRSSEQDEVKALNSGADDYLVKPFAIAELRARMRAALRRFRPDKRIVLVCGQRVLQTPKEFDVLRVLANHQGNPITHTKLMRMVWGLDYGEETDILRVIIRRLRTKIERDPGPPRNILTEPWLGHRFQIPSDPSEKAGRTKWERQRTG